MTKSRPTEIEILQSIDKKLDKLIGMMGKPKTTELSEQAKEVLNKSAGIIYEGGPLALEDLQGELCNESYLVSDKGLITALRRDPRFTIRTKVENKVAMQIVELKKGE